MQARLRPGLVARRRDHDHVAVHRVLHRLADRGLVHPDRERQVQHPAPVRAGADGGGDHLGGRLREGAVEAHRGDPRVRRDPQHPLVTGGAGGDDPRDRRAVVLAVVARPAALLEPRAGRRGAEVDRLLDRSRELGVPGVDAGVDDGDGHPAAGRQLPHPAQPQPVDQRFLARRRGQRCAGPGRLAARRECRGRGGRRQPAQRHDQGQDGRRDAGLPPTPGSPAAACRRPTPPARAARRRAAASSPARRDPATAGRPGAAARCAPRPRTPRRRAPARPAAPRRGARTPPAPLAVTAPTAATRITATAASGAATCARCRNSRARSSRSTVRTAARTAATAPVVSVVEGDDAERGRRVAAGDQAGQQGPGPAHPVEHPVELQLAGDVGEVRGGARQRWPGDPGQPQRQRRRDGGQCQREGRDHGGGAGRRRAGEQHERAAEQREQRGEAEPEEHRVAPVDQRGPGRGDQHHHRGRHDDVRRPDRWAEQHHSERGTGDGGEGAEQGAGRHVPGGVRERCAPAEQQQRQHAEQDPGERAPDRHGRPHRTQHRQRPEHRAGDPGVPGRPAGLGRALPEHLHHVVVERLADRLVCGVQEQQLALPDPGDGQAGRRVEPGAVEPAERPAVRGGPVLLGCPILFGKRRRCWAATPPAGRRWARRGRPGWSGPRSGRGRTRLRSAHRRCPTALSRAPRSLPSCPLPRPRVNRRNGPDVVSPVG